MPSIYVLAEMAYNMIQSFVIFFTLFDVNVNSFFVEILASLLDSAWCGLADPSLRSQQISVCVLGLCLDCYDAPAL